MQPSAEGNAAMIDVALFAIIRERPFTAVTGDVLDAAEFTHQSLLPGIRALQPDAMLIGRAMPAPRAMPVPRAILDGSQRDTRAIKALGFAVISAGPYAQDQRLRGRVRDRIGAGQSTQSIFNQTDTDKTGVL